MTDQPLILWFRRDLRLGDHPMLTAALAEGGRVLPVFILDPETEAVGAAAKWRLGEGIACLAATLEHMGSRLLLRRGPALEVLTALAQEVGAAGVRWSRLYDPASVARDRNVKAGLRAAGITAESHAGHLLHEPWEVQTGQGGFYKVYTPFWNAVRQRPVADALPAPTQMPGPAVWPEGDRLEDWQLGAAMRRGVAVVARYANVGEAAAQERLRTFLDERLTGYAEARDLPGQEATSRMSEHLTYGEISPRVIWHAGMRAMHEGMPGAEKFLKELVWREFGYHLMHHTPEIVSRNWRADWQGFAWRDDNADAERWRRGMTGEPFVDAAMREMFVTGTMHNRARLIAASYLTKHLLTDWRVGQRWFEECLIDWDPASNALGWQWVAGSGPDASPYFRIFNPATQAEKFDADGSYRRRYIAELSRDPGEEALDYFRAVPKRWALAPDAAYPAPMIGLADGRDRALAAYAARNT